MGKSSVDCMWHSIITDVTHGGLWTRWCSLWVYTSLQVGKNMVYKTMIHIRIYMHTFQYNEDIIRNCTNVFRILVAQDCSGLRGISNTISFTAPLNSTLVWLCLALGVQLITRLNLGGYIPSSSLTLSSSLELSPLTKKSMSLSRICSMWRIFLHSSIKGIFNSRYVASKKCIISHCIQRMN